MRTDLLLETVNCNGYNARIFKFSIIGYTKYCIDVECANGWPVGEYKTLDKRPTIADAIRKINSIILEKK